MIRMEQRYLSVDPVLRIRKADDKHIFTYKSGMGMIRQEEEFEISAEDYAKLCEKTIGHPVAKNRYVMELPDRHHAEIDVYHGRLDGLLVVETEFGSEEEANAFEPPVWFGTEVTDDPYADLISVLSCHNVAFLDSTFTGNRTATVLATDWSDQVYFLGNTVHHEKIGRNSFVFRFFGKPVAVVDGCAFTGTAPFCEPSSLRPLSLSRDPLSDEDLSAMRQSASDFKGFEALATPDVKELTQEEISGLDLPASAEGMRTVKVSNVDEFLAAIAPDTVVYMEKGTYNLSEASGYGSIWNDYLSWENPYDGPGLILTGVSGLQIVGAGKDETFLVTEPRYADVLTFDSCSGIELTGLTAGHTQEPGECIGGVLMFRGSSGIGVTSCGLFGCGIRGITAWETQQVTVKDCEIYSCSLGAVQLESCHDFEFSGNSIHDCAYPTFQLFNSSSVVLDGKALSPNASIDLPGAGPYKKAGF